jgi:hypothetical protein
MWKAVEPKTLLHGIVIPKSRFLKSLPSQAPLLPDPWRKLTVQRGKKARMG